MLARTPFTEIEIDGVGTYRLPNQWQSQRLRCLRGEERHTAVLAIGCGRRYVSSTSCLQISSTRCTRPMSP